MKSIPLAEASSLLPFVSYLETNGSVVSRHLDTAGVPLELVQQGQSKITKVQVMRFLNESGAKEGAPDLGFRVGEGFGPDQMGGFGVAIRRGVTLADAIETFHRYLSHWFGDTCAWLERVDKQRCRVHVHATEQLPLAQDISYHNGVFILIHLIRLAAGADWAPNWVRFPKIDAATHRRFSALCNASVDDHHDEIAVEFPAELLAMPLIPRSQPPSPNSELPKANPVDAIDALSEVIRHQILHSKVPTIQVAAEMAGTSPRTLQRRLSADGLSYRRLLDRVRFVIARDLLLDDSPKTGKEIAHSAGFTNHSSFVRSFNRMSGVTPIEFRRKHRG